MCIKIIRQTYRFPLNTEMKCFPDTFCYYIITIIIIKYQGFRINNARGLCVSCELNDITFGQKLYLNAIHVRIEILIK